MRSELTVYPAIFTFDGKYYNVDFIDLKGCSTYGDSIQNAYYMAQDAMGLFLDELVNFPNPTLDISNIKLEKNEADIFNIYDVEKQLEKMQKRKIWLKCGGFITIDPTEALTAIDVNTGKYTGTKDLEQTVFTVNKEASIEIAKQLRLRDIGGIIIIDYIDMNKEENKQKIQNILEEKLKEDRSKTQVEGFTKLDLMEMTRKHICSHK